MAKTGRFIKKPPLPGPQAVGHMQGGNGVIRSGKLPRKPKLAPTSKKLEIPDGLWTKCPECENIIFDKELDENLKVCPICQYHFPMSARERIHLLVETCSFEEINGELESIDPLEFELPAQEVVLPGANPKKLTVSPVSYREKLKANRAKTGYSEAIITGLCMIGLHRVALGVMDFRFLGGSMGSVVGEKVTRLVEKATENRLPVIIIAASGGARMYEGMFSLMQMAKTAAALAYHARAGLPYISVLTHPTTAGVMASFASLGDLIIAEPGAMIGFAGPRVIRETTQSELPPGFQTAEFLLEHGLIDAIVPRKELKQQLIYYLDFLNIHRRAE